MPRTVALALLCCSFALPNVLRAQDTSAAARDSAARDSAARARPTSRATGTDIWIAPLHGRTVGALALGPATNATHRPGYDNQPSFTPDGRSVLYTSVREDAQADIWRYDVRAGTSTRVTSTPESEYSATVTPDGRGFSVIRVERDSAQRLWRFRLDGTDPQLVLERLKPVGYQAWADAHTLALFVLGEPATLRLADTRTGASHIVTDSIGRSLHRIPGQHAISFLRKQADSSWWIERLDPRTGAISRLVRALEGNEDYAWTPAGVILMARGSALYAWDPRHAAEWREIGSVSAPGAGRITRLAVSPSGDRIAFVAEEQAEPVAQP